MSARGGWLFLRKPSEAFIDHVDFEGCVARAGTGALKGKRETASICRVGKLLRSGIERRARIAHGLAFLIQPFDGPGAGRLCSGGKRTCGD